MLGQPLSNPTGQRHIPFFPALRQPQVPAPAQDFDLPADVHSTAQEISVIDGQAQDLGLPQPAARPEVAGPLDDQVPLKLGDP